LGVALGLPDDEPAGGAAPPEGEPAGGAEALPAGVEAFAAAWKAANDFSAVGFTAKTMPI